MNDLNLARLREFLFKEFTEEDLQKLCQDLGLDYGNLPGVGTFGKSRELIAAAQARHIIPELIARMRELRPAAWRIAGLRVGRLEHPPEATAGATATALTEPEVAVEATPAHQPVRQRTRKLLGFIIFIVIVCLIIGGIAFELPQLFQSRPAGTDTGPTSAAAVGQATPTIAAGVTASPTAAPQPSATPQPSPSGIPASPTAAALQPSSTPAPTATPAQTPTATPLPTPTPAVTPTAAVVAPDAIQALVEINQQLAAFYSGAVSTDTLRAAWAGDTYSAVVSYAAKAVKREVGISLAAGDTLSVTMHYVRAPAITAQTGSRTQLTAQEYWRYIHSPGNQTICEIVDYQYTLAKAAGQYQVVAYKGEVVSSTTGSVCGGN